MVMLDANYDRFLFYETPEWAVHSLIYNYPIKFFESFVPYEVIDPCVGRGAIQKAIESHESSPEWRMNWYSNDVDPKRSASGKLDATLASTWESFPRSSWDVCITNPPYGKFAAPIVENAIERSQVSAFYVRNSFHEVTESRMFLKDFPPNVFISLPRYCFRKGKDGKWATDDQPCVWMVWDKRLGKTQHMIYVPKDAIPGFKRHPEV
jgi:hypothetical protein